MKNIYLIVGKSGSGKDTIVNALCDKYGYQRLISYTTRRQRSDPADAKSHIFSDIETYQLDKERGYVIAETCYDGNYYWAIKPQVDMSDIYIIDIPGVKSIKERYHDKGIVVVGIEADAVTRVLRMKLRGDSLPSISARITSDDTEFAEMDDVVDITISNNSLPDGSEPSIDEIVDKLNTFIKNYEDSDRLRCKEEIVPDCVNCDTIGIDSDGKWCPRTKSAPDKMAVLSTIMKSLDGYKETDMVPVSGRLLQDVADVLRDEI